MKQTGAATLYLIAAVAGIIATNAGVYWWMDRQLNDARTALGRAEAQAEQAVAANVDATSQIDRLRARIQTLIQQREAERERLQRDAEQRADQVVALQERLNNARDELDQTLAADSCAARQYPADSYRLLRAAADRAHAHGNGTSTGNDRPAGPADGTD